MVEKQENTRERLYNISKLNVWFAISSIIFFVVLIWSFADDYSRSWKDYQRQFRQLQITKTNIRLIEEKSIFEETEEYKEILNKLEEIQIQSAQNIDEIANAENELVKKKTEYIRAEQRYNFSKADYDAVKYEYEEAVAHNSREAEELKKRLDQIHNELSDYRLAFEAAKENVEKQAMEVRSFSADIKKLKRRKNELAGRANILENKLKNIDPTHMTVSNKIANTLRDLPFFDFMSPYYKVNQVVVIDVTDNVNFTRVPKVDRCITCHQGILNTEFEKDTQPFKTHPRLNLFLSSQSPHPVEKFGCTSCHAGRGRGTDFISTVHMPSSSEQEKEWEEKYQWHQLHNWETPMLPIQYIEASCFKCHSGETFIENADKLNLGMNLMERAGCYGCHKIEKYKDKRRIGPDLNKIASKLNEDWTFQWIKNPKSFRHNTWMPQFFGQSNNNDPNSRVRTDQELKAIVHYLFKHSSDFPLDPIPVDGDIERGEKLVASLGCLGCHRIEMNPFEDETTLQTLRRDHGPNLIGMGSKTTPEWIFTWLKQPESYFPTTMMPNMRLSDLEAADITAYLNTLKRAELMEKNVPSIDENIIDEIALGFLKKMNSDSDARRTLSNMDMEQKLDYNGKKLIRLYGCFGCHNIPGFENDKPIGTELTYEGSKRIERLDFGFVDIPHTKHAWFTQKLKEPRIFDHGRINPPDEKLRMPNFEFKDMEVEALVTVLLGFVKEETMHTKVSPRTARNVFVEEGQWIIRKYNCQGCHLIEGDGNAIGPTIKEYLVNYENMSESEADAVNTSYNPPNLVGEGKKVQPQWLHHFITNPEIIRPWLKTRMPKYALDNDQVNTLVKYFSYLDDQDFPFVNTVIPDVNSTMVKTGELLFSDDYFACGKCHIVGDKLPGGSVDNWAPNFSLAKDRLKPDWIIDWIVNPQNLLPGTKMPTFFDPDYFEWSGPDDIFDGDEHKQIIALRDYILTIE